MHEKGAHQLSDKHGRVASALRRIRALFIEEPYEPPPYESYLNDPDRPEAGLGHSTDPDAPRTKEELASYMYHVLGIKGRPRKPFGGFYSVDRSMGVPIVAQGAPVVEEARLLRAVREGQMNLHGPVDNPRAQELLDAKRQKQTESPSS